MASLKQWQTAFKSHTKEKTGILRAERFRDALLDVGFQVNNDVLSALILRHMRKDGTLRFGDFVSAVLHLTVAFGNYRIHSPNFMNDKTNERFQWQELLISVIRYKTEVSSSHWPSGSSTPWCAETVWFGSFTNHPSYFHSRCWTCSFFYVRTITKIYFVYSPQCLAINKPFFSGNSPCVYTLGGL